ncbi:MAG: VOC family protein [Rhodobacteraceae bacterium]|nr:VOC family protein [Paracoccaceae bacterium]
MATRLEHANITVCDPKATAAMLCRLFGWHIRWQGKAKDNGFTVHVGDTGSDTGSYLALYAPPGALSPGPSSYSTIGGMNHIGVQVDDLDMVEAQVKAAGFTPTNHGDYEPGRRFYFDDSDGIEYEVVEYA